MAKIIDFGAFLPQEPDLKELDRDGLLAYLKLLKQRIAQLDEKEPRSMTSEAYEDWAQCHEELEDMADEVMELLDEL
ncbi:MAG: hypothetical protein IJD21_09360 [Oscillospiraceae bacterium]|nr:hypothetical protein [Oscillospiraceae bacterium]